ncbi:hypothetical protein SORBI_3K044420 [Sorghum bicolor]|uniref:Uncharacterized protein n=1 Tax=Sorghum bicolor TaxID=4558 RepID=A0A1W0VQR3_SORBI|nr:hypothetical protein SORBI_3K044420 [Sorghum bicolor]
MGYRIRHCSSLHGRQSIMAERSSRYSAGSGHLEESCMHRTSQDMHVKQNVSSLPFT